MMGREKPWWLWGQFLRASSKILNENYDKKNFKVFLGITKLTLTSTYLIMDQIVKILLLKVFTSVHPTGFWCAICTAPGYSSFNKWGGNMKTIRSMKGAFERCIWKVHLKGAYHVNITCDTTAARESVDSYWLKPPHASTCFCLPVLGRTQSRRKLFLGSIYISAGWLRI